MATDETNYNNPYVRSPGLNDVGSYLVSGKPYMSGAEFGSGKEVKFVFPAVTKEVMVKGNNANMTLVSTSSAGNVLSGLHLWSLDPNGATDTFNIKCKELYFHTATAAPASVTIYASLTGINGQEMFVLTGSGVTE